VTQRSKGRRDRDRDRDDRELRPEREPELAQTESAEVDEFAGGDEDVVEATAAEDSEG
jgi:hypothetical protein